MFVIGRGLHFYQDFRLSETRKGYFVALVRLFRKIRSNRHVDPVALHTANHTENCPIHWFIELGLFRSDYGKLFVLCFSFDQVRCFRCIGYSYCYFPDSSSLPRVKNQQANGVTVTVVLHSEIRSTKFAVVCFVLGCIVRASKMTTVWCFLVLSASVLKCVVTCGKCMRSCVVSMTTLLFFRKSKPMIGPISVFISMKCSTKVSNVTVKCGCC